MANDPSRKKAKTIYLPHQLNEEFGRLSKNLDISESKLTEMFIYYCVHCGYTKKIISKFYDPDFPSLPNNDGRKNTRL